jgi:type IV pilus assembly protein PilN
MPTINLLPWREELRQKRKRDFLIAALGAVLLGGGLTFGTKFFYQSRIDDQNARNNLLRTEIAELDRQIEEINELDAQKSRLLARMEIIDQLQRSRPEAVHLMDEAVDILPEGAHLTEFRQEGNRIEISGIAQSSTRVSVLMRNVHDSDWLKEPWLDGVQYSGSGPTREGDFTLFANQVRIADDDGSSR